MTCHVFFGLLEQKLFQKTKGHQKKYEGCTDNQAYLDSKSHPQKLKMQIKRGCKYHVLCHDVLYDIRMVARFSVSKFESKRSKSNHW